ncbi:MAG: 4'-phosphopantetheinyl transferase superfamily protein [Bacteroidota bacterium]
MIHISYAIPRVEKHEQLIRQHLHQFPSDFQQKIAKFRFWKDAQASLLGRLLAQEAMMTQFGKVLNYQAIAYTDLGKPYLPNSAIQFNISHTQGMVVCALARELTFGIDVEYKQPIDIRDFKFQMTDGEWQLISNAANQKDEFYNYWTRKEAIIKAEGKGFSMDLKSFEVLSCAHPITVEAKEWYLYPIEIAPTHCCHLAVDKEILAPNQARWIDF